MKVLLVLFFLWSSLFGIDIYEEYRAVTKGDDINEILEMKITDCYEDENILKCEAKGLYQYPDYKEAKKSDPDKEEFAGVKIYFTINLDTLKFTAKQYHIAGSGNDKDSGDWNSTFRGYITKDGEVFNYTEDYIEQKSGKEIVQKVKLIAQ